MRCGRLGSVGVGGVAAVVFVLTFGLCFNLGHASPEVALVAGRPSSKQATSKTGLVLVGVGTITWYYNFCRSALLGGAAPAAARSSDGRLLPYCPLRPDADDRTLLRNDGATLAGTVGAVDIALYAAAEA